MSIPKKKRFRIKTLKLREVSLVDRGMNPLSNVVLYKRDPSKETEMTDKALEQITKERDDLQKASGEMSKEISFLKENLEKLNARVASVESEKAELQKKLDGDKTPEPLKLPPEIQAQVEKAMAEATQAREELAKMRDSQDTAMFVAKAAEMKALPQKPEEFGPVLKRLAQNKATPEDVIALETVLKGASAAIEKGILTPSGSNSAVPSEASQKIEELAKKRAESDKVTYATAYSKVLNENPELYAQYLSERQ